MFRRIMMVLVLVVALGGAFAPGVAAGPPDGEAPVIPARARGIPDEYIVVLKAGHAPDAVLRGRAITPGHVYDAALQGFSARLDTAQVAELRRHPGVAYIEQDQEVGIAATEAGAPWGLDRLDQRALPLSGTYTYTQTAANVTAYIIDTGIQTAHPDFGGRASVAKDVVGDGKNGQDCNGHGTHVAGIVGGAKYGVAKGVKLRSVRVLDCNGSGTLSGVVAGINFVTWHHDPLAVVNISLTATKSASMDTALAALLNAGVFVVAAAGNDNGDACAYSPAGTPGVFAVGATDKTDAKAIYSNYGRCVQAFAPGDFIPSDWLNGGTATLRGTSLAAPHVAGIVALYLATYGHVPNATISTWLITNASPTVKNLPGGTPNRLVYKAGL